MQTLTPYEKQQLRQKYEIQTEYTSKMVMRLMDLIDPMLCDCEEEKRDAMCEYFLVVKRLKENFAMMGKAKTIGDFVCLKGALENNINLLRELLGVYCDLNFLLPYKLECMKEHSFFRFGEQTIDKLEFYMKLDTMKKMIDSYIVKIEISDPVPEERENFENLVTKFKKCKKSLQIEKETSFLLYFFDGMRETLKEFAEFYYTMHIDRQQLFLY